MRRKCSNRLLTLLFIIGVLLSSVGILFHLYFPDILDSRVKSEITLREGSQIFPKWQKTPVAIDFKVFILEVVNSRRVSNFGDTPIVRERGPFHFTEYRSKRVLGYSPDGGTVKYKEIREYYFDRSKSIDNLDRKVTFVNVPVVTIATRITDFLNKLPFQPLTRPIVNGAIYAFLEFHNQNLFTTRSVRELLFEGYRVDVLDTIKLISVPLSLIGIHIPHIPLINNTFGIFYNKNNTPDGPFEVHTGVNDFSKIGQFVTWKDKRSLNHWKGKACNTLNGTDGIQFSPFLRKEDILSVFTFEACRSVLLGFERETEVKGIKTYRFKSLPSNFRSAKKNSANWCYCNKNKKSCNYDGVIDISPCWFNAPLYASNPHFYNASRSIIEKVKGLKPDEEKHTSYVDIEPTTGSVLRGARRFALNIEIKNFPIIATSRNILKPALIPIIWVEETSQLSDELRDEMVIKLFMTRMIAEVGIKAIIAIGFGLFSIVFIIFCCKGGRNNAVQCASSLDSKQSEDASTSRKTSFISTILSKLPRRNVIPQSLLPARRESEIKLPISESGSEISEGNTTMEASTFSTRRQSVSVLKNNDLLAELKQMQKTTEKEINGESHGNNSKRRRKRLSKSKTIDELSTAKPEPPLRRRSLMSIDVSKLVKQANKSLNFILPSTKEESMNEESINKSSTTMCQEQEDKNMIAPVEVIPKLHRVSNDRRMSLYF